MTFNARTARKLCSDSELELYEQSRQFELQSLSEKQLKHSITRARRQFEKLAGRRRKDAAAAAKTELMHEILARFERQLVRLVMNLKEEGRSSEAPPFIGDGADYTRLGPPSEEIRARAHADETALAATRRIEGMISSRDRRTQIRHDKR
jgi:hypothetical protein